MEKLYTWYWGWNKQNIQDKNEYEKKQVSLLKTRFMWLLDSMSMLKVLMFNGGKFSREGKEDLPYLSFHFKPHLHERLHSSYFYMFPL